jgi:hypothetical protein
MVRFNKPINSAVNNYDDQFKVFDDGVEMTISSVERYPGDQKSALIMMTESATGTVTVSYGDVKSPGLGVSLPNVIKDEDDLPAPRFGPLEVESGSSRINSWRSY